jgi:hypothetical protein
LGPQKAPARVTGNTEGIDQFPVGQPLGTLLNAIYGELLLQKCVTRARASSANTRRSGLFFVEVRV